jgi:pyridoxine kinase
LTGCKINSISSLYKALDILHSSSYSVPNVAISSIPLSRSVVESLKLAPPPLEYTALVKEGSSLQGSHFWHASASTSEGNLKCQNETTGPVPGRKEEEHPTALLCFASTKIAGEESPQTFAFALPWIEGYFSGVGDLFSALVLGFYERGTVASDATDPPTVVAPQTTELTRDHDIDANNLAANLPVRLPPFAAAVSKALMGVQLILLKTHLHSLRTARDQRAKRSQKKDSRCCEEPDEEDCLPSDPELDSVPPKPVSEGGLPKDAHEGIEDRPGKRHVAKASWG